VILRAALRSPQEAMFWALAAQGATVLGALLAVWFAPALGSALVGALLALGGGTFLYLGFHAVHGEWKRRSAAKPVQIG
jgi:zinc transporter ZupT